MAIDFVYGNIKRSLSIDRPPAVKHVPLLDDNLLLMNKKQFEVWLEKNNKTAKPISQLIEEYDREHYEDNRPFSTKRR